ncbi:MAG: class III extradiol ring-cleavage dioxygenase [Spirochaetota bacterium]
MTQYRYPILFLNHGGGPLPLLGDPQHQGLVNFLQNVCQDLPIPKSILVISAHWEEDVASITSAEKPGLIYDYFGFPKEAYEIEYPADGDRELALRLGNMLQQKGIQSNLDKERGFDHGMFVPLKLLYPQANVPCVQLSLLNSMDPAKHIQLGQAISHLREENIFIIGSGMSFHNLPVIFSQATDPDRRDLQFNDWLVTTCCDPNISFEAKKHRLVNWTEAPFARFCHPREEHLLPLLVCFGAGLAYKENAQQVSHLKLFGKQVSNFLWGGK